MANRIPRFESHIRPMMRRIDRDRMLDRFDLWSYDDVVANATTIFDRVSRPRHEPVHGEMPPSGFGGPWPEEWIAIFERWMDGFPRLESPSADVTFEVIRISADTLSLKATGTNPDVGFAVWLEYEFGAGDALQFSLFREPPEQPPPFGNTDFSASIDFEDIGATSLSVNGIDVPINV